MILQSIIRDFRKASGDDPVASLSDDDDGLTRPGIAAPIGAYL